NQSDQVIPINRGPFGTGFTGDFGRIFKDMRYIDGCDTSGANPNKSCPGYTTTYTWVSPDGSEHLIHHDAWLQNPPYQDPGPPWTRRPTNDLSYALISGPDTSLCPSTGQTVGCFKVETSDGLIYTLENRVDCIQPVDGRANPTQYQRDRAANLNFCGWYTTRIEDRSTTA